MSNAEPWPTEEAATKAVDAAARTAYNDFVDSHHQRSNEGPFFPPWELLEPAAQLKFRQSVLNFVWAALTALPDPRYAAWEEGCAAGEQDALLLAPAENPYPSGL